MSAFDGYWIHFAQPADDELAAQLFARFEADAGIERHEFDERDGLFDWYADGEWMLDETDDIRALLRAHGLAYLFDCSWQAAFWLPGMGKELSSEFAIFPPDERRPTGLDESGVAMLAEARNLLGW